MFNTVHRDRQDDQIIGDRPAGLCLIITSLLVVFTMAHHPTSHGHGSVNALVHGSMIALILVTMFGLTRFAIALSAYRASSLSGLIAFAAATLSNVVAAMINGFIAPPLAGGPEPVAHDILRLLWEANQAFARPGVIATGAAFMLWSINLVTRRATAPRALGVAGLLAGVMPIIALLAGSDMDVRTAFVVYSAHAAWLAAIGIWLYRSPSAAAAASH